MESFDARHPTWRLLKGDVLIGTLHSCSQDWPWFLCSFEPTSDFKDYAELFAREASLLEAGAENAQDRLDATRQLHEQKFTLELDDGSVTVTRFLLHIRGNEAQFRPFRSSIIERSSG